MKRIHCKFCHAKPKVQFAVTYAGHQMCQDCRWEYQAIFEGKASKQLSETRNEDPLKEKHRWGLQDLDWHANRSLRMWNGYYDIEMLDALDKKTPAGRRGYGYWSFSKETNAPEWVEFNKIKRMDDGISEDS